MAVLPRFANGATGGITAQSSSARSCSRSAHVGNRLWYSILRLQQLFLAVLAPVLTTALELIQDLLLLWPCRCHCVRSVATAKYPTLRQCRSSSTSLLLPHCSRRQRPHFMRCAAAEWRSQCRTRRRPRDGSSRGWHRSTAGVGSTTDHGRGHLFQNPAEYVLDQARLLTTA